MMKSVSYVLALALVRNAYAWHPRLDLVTTKPISRSDAIKGVVGSVFLAGQSERAFAAYSDDDDDDLKGLLKKLKDPDAPRRTAPQPTPPPEPAPAPAPKSKKLEPAAEPSPPAPAPKPVEPETSSADERKARAKAKADKANANYAKPPSPAPAAEAGAEEKAGGFAIPSLPAFPSPPPSQAPVAKVNDPAAARRAAEAERKAKVAAAIAEKKAADAAKRDAK